MNESSPPFEVRVLKIFPGPIHDLDAYFQKRMEGISSYQSGTILVLGGRPQRCTYGRYEVIVQEFSGPAILKLLAMIRAALAIVRARKRSGESVQLVTTYDPLKGGIVAVIAARVAGARLMVELNGDFTDPHNYADVANPVLRILKRWLFVSVEGLVLHFADAVRLLHRSQIEPFRWLLRTSVVRVIHAFVDTERFINLGESPEVLFVGFPYHLKGVDLLIRAFKRISDEFPEWTLTIMGWYPDRTELDRDIAGHPRIRVQEPVPYREMPAYIGGCGILVLPSRTEAMGRVLVEAMAAGKPRVGARTGGIPTVINDGVDGLLFESGNVGSLEGALRRLMSDAGLRRQLGENGKERAVREFSPPAYFRSMRRFIEEIADLR